MFNHKYYDNAHQSDDGSDHNDSSIINSPPSGLITLSPNTPILHFNPFGYVDIDLFIYLFSRYQSNK